MESAQHGHDTQAEIRDILKAAVRPEDPVRLGSLLASIGREDGGLTEADVSRFAQLRDDTPAEPTDFS